MRVLTGSESRVQSAPLSAEARPGFARNLEAAVLRAQIENAFGGVTFSLDRLAGRNEVERLARFGFPLLLQKFFDQWLAILASRGTDELRKILPPIAGTPRNAPPRASIRSGTTPHICCSRRRGAPRASTTLYPFSNGFTVRSILVAATIQITPY